MESESKNGFCLNPRTVHLEIETDSVLKPGSLCIHIKRRHSQKAYANREDFDLGLKKLSMNRSWLSFVIKYTEIENV